MSSSGQPFPMSKLVYMYVKRLAQPLASRIISRAKKDQFFKTYICLPPANMYHFYEAKVKFKIMNIGKVRMNKVPKLLEKDAVVLGANLFSEFCIYAVASAFALNEVMKFKAREREKDESLEDETKDLLEDVAKLDKIVDKQLCDINNLDKLVLIYKKELIALDS